MSTKNPVSIKVNKPPVRRKKKAQITAVRVSGFELDAGPSGGAVQSSNQVPEPGDAVPDVTDTGLCVEILMAGFVQSYVDFFYLTHRPDPNAPANPDGTRQEIVVSPADMVKIKEWLTSAERARRAGSTGEVYDCYNRLAEYYQGANDSKTGIYFFEKCQEIARLTEDVQGELRANHNLGLANQSLGNTEKAISYHERHLEMSRTEGLRAEEAIAAAELVKVYQRRAEELEEGPSADLTQALSFHEKCLASSKVAGDRVAEGLANFRLGRAFVLLDDPVKAVSVLESYVAICKENSDLAGEGAACSALAAAYQSLNNTSNAVEHLEKFLGIALRTEDLTSQGEAHRNLGVIYNRSGDFDKAVSNFERNFELARTLVAQGGPEANRRLVDKARVLVGMARGNAQMKRYLHIISYDMGTLLKWKNRRAAFGGSGARR